MAERDFAGLLFIGDPHLSTRAPGWRKDDYPKSILEKLRWCFGYAREHRLLVVILGDLFHLPRDVSNQTLVELLSLLAEPVWAVAGNHDCHENALTDSDTLSVLEAAGRVKLLNRVGPWVGNISGRTVVVGGTCWGARIPESFDLSQHAAARRRTCVFWVTHHDVRFPGYEESARFGCFEIPGVDVVINGHIHRVLPDVKIGQTTWMNPGNIARVSRSDATRQHAPAALRMDISADGWRAERVAIPHQSFDEVFHAEIEVQSVETEQSSFIQALAALEQNRTASGAG